AVFNQGLYRWRCGLGTDAELAEALEEVSRDVTASGYASYLLGLVHVMRHDPTQAQKWLLKAPSSIFEQSDYLSALGIARFNGKDFAGAATCFARAASQSAERALDHWRLACALWHLGRREEAEQELRRARQAEGGQSGGGSPFESALVDPDQVAP